MATSSFQLLRTKTLVLPSAPLSFLCPCSIFQQIHWAQSSEHMWNSITSQHLHRCHPGPNHHSLALGDDSCFWLSLFLPSRQFFTQQLVWAFKNISQVSPQPQLSNCPHVTRKKFQFRDLQCPLWFGHYLPPTLQPALILIFPLWSASVTPVSRLFLKYAIHLP